MGQKLSPSRALMKRHHAAMEIVQTLGRRERVQLLYHVLVGSPEIDAALEQAEAQRQARAEKRARERELVGAR